MFHCPICGAALPGGFMPAHRCRETKVSKAEAEYSEFEEADDEDERRRVFTNCNVCGRKLHTDDEDKMGMCLICAAE